MTQPKHKTSESGGVAGAIASTIMLLPVVGIIIGVFIVIFPIAMPVFLILGPPILIAGIYGIVREAFGKSKPGSKPRKIGNDGPDFGF